MAITVPKTEEECRSLQAWAENQPIGPVAASPDQIAKHLSFLAAALPSRAVDEESAKMRFAVYQKILGAYPAGAIAFMARRACETLDWFPTPRQCLNLIRDYVSAPGQRETALRLCHDFWQQEFDRFIDALRAGEIDQAAIDAKPERWRRIAVERGYLRRMTDGSFVIRRQSIAA